MIIRKYSKFKGKRVLVTRPKHQAYELISRLKKSGAKVIHIPLIEIDDPHDHFRALDFAISRLDKYDWLVFTSQNAVLKFFQRFRSLGSPLPLWERARVRGHIAAIGPTTKKILQAEGVSDVILPQKDSYSAQGLIKALRHYDFRDKHVLFPSAREILEALPAWLKKRGAKVDVVETYQTIIPKDIDKAKLQRLINSNKIDTVFFHSPSALKNFVRIVGRKAVFDFSRRATFRFIGGTTASAYKAISRLHRDL